MSSENAVPQPTQGEQSGLEVPVCRQYLKDLELPPEVKREVEAYCRERGYRRRADLQRVEEDLKLQFFFGGKDVGFMPTPQGRLVVAVGEMNSEAFSVQLGRLTPEERQRTILYSPEPWDTEATRI
jgi:hypothetical protein